MFRMMLLQLDLRWQLKNIKATQFMIYPRGNLIDPEQCYVNAVHS